MVNFVIDGVEVNAVETCSCAHCGQVIEESDNRYVTLAPYSSTFCQDCLDSNYYSKCPDCGGYVRTMDMTTIYNEDGLELKKVCRNCKTNYTMCNNCCRRFINLDAMSSENISYCMSCYNNRYDDYDDDDYICDTIEGYHYHKYNQLTFFDCNNGIVNTSYEEDGNKLYLGAEIEADDIDYHNSMSDLDDIARYAENTAPEAFLVFEQDGSLDNGFETITRPATLEYHRHIFEKYVDIFTYYKNHAMSGFDNNCGLHIHFNKNFLKSKHDYKYRIRNLMTIIDRFKEQLIRFSRRNEIDLNDWASFYDDDPDYIAEKVADNYSYYSRYCVINFTNKHTIEFRLFDGTLDPNTYLAALELVDNIVKTTMNYDYDYILNELKWEDLLVSDVIKKYWDRVC